MKDPRELLSAVLNPAATRKCRNCQKLVRQCPNCDEPYRLLNGLPVKCSRCSTVFM